ncbi:MAG: hypothetical protein IJT36_03555 [Alphaproteobacteria bacterium]|nr:hypothetical protein [Alphaproteobacteria bacterium]
MLAIGNVRPVPKDIRERVYGEGDMVLRDKKHRIIAHKVGYDDASWEKLKKRHPGSYSSIAYYDVQKCMII